MARDSLGELLQKTSPFYNPLVTESIEEPETFQELFSDTILISETRQVFQPQNAVLIGPQGTGKSMILNLIRYPVLTRWIARYRSPPPSLESIHPFLGISINLTRANFQIFGNRSVARAMYGTEDKQIESTCAADYLNHFMFKELLKALQSSRRPTALQYRRWLGVELANL